MSSINPTDAGAAAIQQARATAQIKAQNLESASAAANKGTANSMLAKLNAMYSSDGANTATAGTATELQSVLDKLKGSGNIYDTKI